MSKIASLFDDLRVQARGIMSEPSELSEPRPKPRASEFRHVSEPAGQVGTAAGPGSDSSDPRQALSEPADTLEVSSEQGLIETVPTVPTVPTGIVATSLETAAPWADDPAERCNWINAPLKYERCELPPLPDDDEHASWLRCEPSTRADPPLGSTDRPDGWLGDRGPVPRSMVLPAHVARSGPAVGGGPHDPEEVIAALRKIAGEETQQANKLDRRA